MVFYGDFIFFSGKKVMYYVDMCKFMLDYCVVFVIGCIMFDLIGDFDVVVVGGLMFGVDLIVNLVLYVLVGIDCLFDVFVVCKEFKDYGCGC